MAKPNIAGDGRTVTIRVPISIRRRGGRKLVLSPDGMSITTTAVCRHIDNAMVKAVARAFRWREMLESGEFATIREIADAENIHESYVSRVLRLTLLAPNFVEAVLAGSHPPNMQLDTILQRFTVDWRSQLEEFGAVAKNSALL